MKRLARSLAIALPLLATPALAQTTWYVDASAPGPGTGTLADPFPAISDAIAAPTTVSGDTVEVAAGIYLDSFDLSGKSIRVVGAPGPRPLIRGNGTDRYCTIESGEGPGTEIAHLEFAFGNGGSAGDFGGAARVVASSARFTDCVFRENRACEYGGAIDTVNATLELIDCEFTGNRSAYGGAIAVQSGTCFVDGCRFEGNSTDTAGTICTADPRDGGAIYAALSSTVIEDSDFFENEASHGGAIESTSPLIALSVTRCDFARNKTIQRGGAIQSDDALIADCQFRENASGSTAAVYRDDGTVTLLRCVFEHNVASFAAAAHTCVVEDSIFRENVATQTGGGGVPGAVTASTLRRCIGVGNRSLRGPGFAGTTELEQCTIVGNTGFGDHTAVRDGALDSSIVWGNFASLALGPIAGVDGTLVTNSLVEGDPSTITGPPLFFDREGGDLRLLPGSPAIDAGSPGLPLDPDGSPADVGAIPFDPTARVDAATYCVAKETSDGCTPRASLLGLVSTTAPLAQFRVDGVPAGTPVLLIASNTAVATNGFFGGTLCVGDPIVRGDVQFALPASGCGDAAVFDVDAALLGQIGSQPGDLVFLQAWFRDIAQPDGTGVGLSDAVVATVQN